MNTNKFLLTFITLFSFLSFNAQLTVEMELSETSSEHKLVPHTEKTSYPDSITIKGYISVHQKGICGEICAGGTIKFELYGKVEGYPYSYMYIVTSCSAGETNKELIELNVLHYTGKETECYYKDIVDIIDSKKTPYYKISEEETKKTITQ